MSAVQFIIAFITASFLWRMLMNLFKKGKKKDFFSDCLEVSGKGEIVLDMDFIVQKSSIDFADQKKIFTCDPGSEDEVCISHDKCKIKISWNVSGIREICFEADGKNKCLGHECEHCNNKCNKEKHNHGKK